MRSIVILLSFSSVALAQDTRGNISGTVTDPQGAVIAGAGVIVANTGTGTSSGLSSNSSGYYEAPLLLPGSYSVTVETAGFKKNPMEWWHYDLPDAAKYPLRDEPFVQPDAGP